MAGHRHTHTDHERSAAPARVAARSPAPLVAIPSPMATLSLTLLGDVACALEGRPLRFARRSALALLVYLACAGRAQSRAALAALVAGESDEARASMAFRNALRDLRAVLGDLLLVDTRSVALAPDLLLASDLAAFEDAARAGLEQRSLPLLRQAAARYAGDFAPGLALRGAPALDEWLLHERERLHALALRVLEQLAEAEERAGDRPGAIATTRRVLAAEPWREEAHRRLIRLLAADGQRAAALLQLEQCRAALRRELGVEPQPETLALLGQLQAAPVAPPHNLPARSSTFIDRSAERALLAEQLRRPDCRLLTLVGIGGAGKTRLALELAAEFARPGLPGELAFPDGVFFVSCGEAGGAGSPAALPLALALLGSLSLTVTPGANPEAVLLGWLAARRVLLVLDNAEADPAVAPFAGAVLGAAAQVRLLITSRVRLRLEAERVFDLGGLGLPAGVEDLERSEAGQLFLERARAVRLRQPPGVGDYAQIVRICRLVHGLPLAIVLAAARLRVLSCAAIADQLTHDLGLLVSEAPDLPERQRNLGAVLRWSYGQLRPDEARCLRQLSVIRGGFDGEAARAVSGCTLALLEVLADYGLITWGDERYSLHPLVHHIATEELANSHAERAQAEEHHARHFAAVAAGLSNTTGQDEEALQAISTHWDNLVAAWRWAVAQRSWQALGQLRAALARVWDALGMFREGISLCEGAAAALGRRAAPGSLVPGQAAQLAELLLMMAWFHSRLAESDRAAALLEEARPFAARAGGERLLERVDHQQGVQLYLQTRYRAARPLLERALGVAVQRGHRPDELEAMSALARLAHRAGDAALMRSVVEAAEQRFGDRADSLEMGYIRFAAAHLAVDLHGDVAPGYALIAQDGQRSGELEHHQMQYWRWSLEWFLACAEGRYAHAEALFQPAMERAASLRNGFVPTIATLQLADAVLAQGDGAEADQLYLGALQRGLALGTPLLQSMALLGRARAAEQRGAYPRALDLAGAALGLAREEGFQRLVPRACVVLGHAQAGLGQYAEAAERYTEALTCDMAVGHSARVTAGVVALAAARRAQGDDAGAIQLLSPQLALLLNEALTGMDEPVRTLLSAAETLRAAGDPRADRLVERARGELARRAGLVRPERREAFLAIPAHRALQAGPAAVAR